MKTHPRLRRLPLPARQAVLLRTRRPIRFEFLEARLALAAADLSFPFIPDQTLYGGAPIWLGIDSSGADGPLTYSVSVDNVNLLQAVIPTGDKSLVLNTSGAESGVTGQMTFELFDTLAPRTTQHIEALVNNGEFATNAQFYRISHFNDAANTPFVIQGGPAFGTSSLGPFDDEYNPDLQFTSGDLLAMAKSTDDTNDNQVFVTAGPTRFLDFQHSIFGVLTEGEAVRQAIQNSRTTGDGPPPTPITIDSAQIITDPQNAALELKAPVGVTGFAAVTLTVKDAQNHTYSQVFHVNIAPDPNDPAPFLDPIAPVVGVENHPINLQLTATDVQNRDPDFFDAQKPSAETVNYSLNVDHNSGLVTITPPQNFTGTFQVLVGVRGSQTRTTADQFDIQTILVTVIPSENAAPTANDDSYSVPINGALAVPASSGVLSNDADAAGDPLSAVLISQPNNGTVVLNSDGSFTYQPTPGFHGDDTFTYAAADSNNHTDQATVTIHVDRVDFTIQLKKFDGSPLTSLVPGDDFLVQVYAEDLRPQAQGVLAAYMDLLWNSNLAVATGPIQYGDFPNSHPLNAVSPGLLDDVGGVAGNSPTGAGPLSVLSITMRATGVGNLTFTLDPADLLPDHAVRLYGDDNAVPTNEVGYASASVGIAATANHPPVATNDTYNFPANQSQFFVDKFSGVLANDSDPDGDPLTATQTGSPANGTVTLNPDGSFLYFPNSGFSGSDFFNYEVTDSHGATAEGLVRLNVSSGQPRVQLSLELTRPDGSPLSDLASGQDFVLHVFAQDLQSMPHGVFAAYLDVAWDPSLATATGPIQYSAIYPNGHDTHLAGPGFLDEAGGFDGSAELGGFQTEVFSIPMRALAPGLLNFTSDPADNIPPHDVLVYGSNNAVPSADVTYGSASIAISAPPPPPTTPGVTIENGSLLITGGDGRDQLTMKVGYHAIVVKGTIGNTRVNQTLYTRFAQHILVNLGAGNDSLKIDGLPRMPIIVDAGDGNDSVTITNASAILLGGEGNDRLVGGRVRDLLLGGNGQDELRGNGGQDILIGGTTSFDQDLLALIAIQAEWNTPTPYATRTATIANGDSPLLNAAGASLQQDVTVFSDDAVDTLLGGADLNWLFSDSSDRTDLALPHSKRATAWH